MGKFKAVGNAVNNVFTGAGDLLGSASAPVIGGLAGLGAGLALGGKQKTPDMPTAQAPVPPKGPQVRSAFGTERTAASGALAKSGVPTFLGVGGGPESPAGREQAISGLSTLFTNAPDALAARRASAGPYANAGGADVAREYLRQLATLQLTDPTGNAMAPGSVSIPPVLLQYLRQGGNQQLLEETPAGVLTALYA